MKIGAYILVFLLFNTISVTATTPRFYPEISFTELFSNPYKFDEKYISLYGYYDKETNLFKENPEENKGLVLGISPECRDYSYGPECKFSEDKWVSIAGLFEYENTYEMKAELIHSGRKTGSKCVNDNECQYHICLLAPNMKMILPDTTYEDLPPSAKIVNLEIKDSKVKTFFTNSVVILDKGPDYGFCLGYALPPTPVPPDDSDFFNKVRQTYIEKGVIEGDEPFVLGALTLGEKGGTGYAIAEWNNNKYQWILLKPGDEKYFEWIKEAITEAVGEEEFNNNFKLISANRPSIPSINYIPDRKLLFAEFLVNNEFPVYHTFTTHHLVDGSWVEVNKEDFKKTALEQYKDALEKSQQTKVFAVQALQAETLSGESGFVKKLKAWLKNLFS